MPDVDYQKRKVYRDNDDTDRNAEQIVHHGCNTGRTAYNQTRMNKKSVHRYSEQYRSENYRNDLRKNGAGGSFDGL